jgi:hypothetical protein
LNRSSCYYAPAQESVENLELMRLIDEQFDEDAILWAAADYRRSASARDIPSIADVCSGVARLIGIEAIYQKPCTSVAMAGHQKYPYLLPRCGDCPPKPGVVDRYHLHPDGARLHVPGGGDGLVQPAMC